MRASAMSCSPSAPRPNISSWLLIGFWRYLSSLRIDGPAAHAALAAWTAPSIVGRTKTVRTAANRTAAAMKPTMAPALNASESSCSRTVGRYALGAMMV